MTDALTNYIAAFERAKGYTPSIRQLPNGRFEVTTRTGTFDRYSEADIRNLTRAMEGLAA
jgi:hypothetical protein